MFDVDLYPFLNRVSRPAARRYESWRRTTQMRMLKSVDPDTLEQIGEKRALSSFHSAARSVPYYREFLRGRSLDPDSIRTMDDFLTRVPVIGKEIFHQADIASLAVGGTIADAKNILTSSGFSGRFSFGINLAKNLENTARLIDTVLDYALAIGTKKTLAINCLPMGVKAYTNIMALAEVSVREDMALALVEKFHKYFKQIVIIGEAFFLKYLVEEGIRKGLDWKSLPVSLITGEDSFPESYRTYMANLMGIALEVRPITRLIGSSLGIAEIDLNLFHETPDTIRIRRLADADPEFRLALFGENLAMAPMLFQYYPHRTFVEKSRTGGFTTTTITTFVPCKIPLIRYDTKDMSLVISYRKVVEVLSSFGKGDWAPELRLPLIAVQSRHAGSASHTKIADDVRRAIFSDPEVAKRVTGYFKILDGAGGKRADLQLEKDFSSENDEREIAARLNIEGMKIHPIPYYQFPEALTLDYNKKFRH